MNLVIKKVIRDWGPSPSVEKAEYFEINAPTEDEAFTTYFRDCENRFRYCNDIFHVIVDPVKRDKYTKWIGDINNYAKAGGDMW